MKRAGVRHGGTGHWPATMALVAVAVALIAAPVAADEADSCMRVAARLAGPAAPHVVDPPGDATPWAETPVTGGPAAYDIQRAWLSQVGETPLGQRFAVNIQLADLSSHPAQAVFMADFSGLDWVRAKAMPDGSWEWHWGTVHELILPVHGRRDVFVPEGSTSGEIDPSSGLIRIDIPEHMLPSAPADGSEVYLSGLQLRSGHAADSPVPVDAGLPPDASNGFLLQAEDTENASVCDVVLYEAAEA